MNKNISSLFIVTFLLFLSIDKFHSLYAGTKYLGQNYNSALMDMIPPADMVFNGTMDGDPTNETIWCRLKWFTDNEGDAGHQLHNNAARLVNTYTANASPQALSLDVGDTILYVSGSIDNRSASALTAAGTTNDSIFRSQWGEGRDIMENYTHLGFYLYSDATPGTNTLKVVFEEIDLMDTHHAGANKYFYEDECDAFDSFPAAFYTDLGGDARDGYKDNDSDGINDVDVDVWGATVAVDWIGWKFVLLRLGHTWGNSSWTLENASDTDFIHDDPMGDFEDFNTNQGDGRFNIREIYEGVGNPWNFVGLTNIDTTDSWYLDSGDAGAYEMELWLHFERESGGTSLPQADEDHWRRGDLEGLKQIYFFFTTGSGTMYIDNMMFTRPIPSGTTMTDTMRIDYAWISDSINTTLYDTSDTPLSKNWHEVDNDWGDNIATHYGSLWYDITGFIPPTFSAVLDGDASETMSRISIVAQSDYTTLLNTSNQPYFYGNGAVGTTSPNNGADGIFQSPNVNTPPLSYATWYTMFVTPRGSDGNDTTASVGYPQVVNFRFTKPTTKMKVLQSEELSN